MRCAPFLLLILAGCDVPAPKRDSGKPFQAKTDNPTKECSDCTAKGASGPSGPSASSGPSGPSSPTPEQPGNKFKRTKVLLIGIDGMRPDALAQANAPNLHELGASGAFSDHVETNDTTISGPGWSSILTGVWRDLHGVVDNNFTVTHYDLHPELLSLIEQAEPTLRTARITNWAPLHEIIPTTADLDLPFDYEQGGDVPAVDRAVSLLSGDDPVDVLFFYFAMVDVTGHAYGFHPSVPEYVAAIETVDQQLGQLQAALKQRPTFANEDWLIVVTSDHGGTADKLHGRDIPEHRRVNLILHGDRVPPGIFDPAPQQVDVVPTILNYLKLASNHSFDGRIAAVQPHLPRINENLLLNADAERDVGRAGITMNSAVWGWEKRDGGIAVAYSGNFAGSGAGSNYFIGGESQRAVMSQSVDVSAIAAGQLVDINVDLGGYQAQDDSAELFVRFIGDQHLAACDGIGQSYFFRGSSMQVYGHSATGASPATDIVTTWPDLDAFTGGASNLDACARWDATHGYFFKGEQVILWDFSQTSAAHPQGRKVAGYPKAISAEWPALARLPGGAKNIETVLVWSATRVYMFKQGQYMRLDKSTGATTTDYPRYVSSETWPGLYIDRFYGGIHFARSDKFYFFREDGYVRYDIATDRVDDAYPDVVDSSTWPGLDWATSPTSVHLGPVTAAERSSVTQLLHRQALNVAMPAGTKKIAVDLVFVRDAASGDNDGSADNLSIILHP